MTKGSRVLATFSLFASLTAFSQVDPQISVKEFKVLRDEAKSMIKGFDLSKDIGSVGAPDYRFVRERMRSILDQKPAELEKFLISFNNEISDDYNIIQSVKDLGKGKAIKQTADVANKRFQEKARGFQGSYQNALLSFVEKDLVGLEKECLTVLCVNQVREDLKAWFKQAKKMNKPLKLDGVTLARSGDVNKRTANHIKAAASPSIISGKPIAFQRDSNEFKTLSDSRLSDDLLSIYTLSEVQKLTSEQLDRASSSKITDSMKEKYGLKPILSLSKNAYKTLMDSRITEELMSAYTLEELGQLTPAQLDRYQNGKIPAGLKERYGLKAILALSDAGFKNLMDPLMTQKDLETFKLEDIASKGLITLRRANEKCYEVSKMNKYDAEFISTYSDFKQLNLSDGRTLKYDGSYMYVQSGNKTFAQVYVGHGVKAKPLELKNGNIAVPTKKGVVFFSPAGKIISKVQEGNYFAADLFEASNGSIIAANENGEVVFMNSSGKEISYKKNITHTAIRRDAIRSENGKIIVEDLNGEKGVFDLSGKLLYTESKSSVGPVKFSDGSRAEFQGDKIRFINSQNELTSEHNGKSSFVGNALVMENGTLLVARKSNTISMLEIFDKNIIAPISLGLYGEARSLKEISPGKIEVRTSSDSYLINIKTSPNAGEAVVQIPCSEEQIRDLTISRKTEKGATKQ